MIKILRNICEFLDELIIILFSNMQTIEFKILNYFQKLIIKNIYFLFLLLKYLVFLFQTIDFIKLMK